MIRDSIRMEAWGGKPLIAARDAGQTRLTDPWFSRCANTGVQAGLGDPYGRVCGVVGPPA
jgi:hypothetical protein